MVYGAMPMYVGNIVMVLSSHVIGAVTPSTFTITPKANPCGSTAGSSGLFRLLYVPDV
jgi:hypothetical protein